MRLAFLVPYIYIYDCIILIDIHFNFRTHFYARHFISFGPIMKVGILGTQNAKLGFRARFRERFGPTTWPSELGVSRFPRIFAGILSKTKKSYVKTMKRCDLGTICGVKQCDGRYEA